MAIQWEKIKAVYNRFWLYLQFREWLPHLLSATLLLLLQKRTSPRVVAMAFLPIYQLAKRLRVAWHSPDIVKAQLLRVGGMLYPPLQRKIQTELLIIAQDLENEHQQKRAEEKNMKKYNAHRITQLPDKDMTPIEILNSIDGSLVPVYEGFLKIIKESKLGQKRTRLSGGLYSVLSKAQLALETTISLRANRINPLHRDIDEWNQFANLGIDITAILLDLFHAPEGSVGRQTSGGTESIRLACLAARNLALKKAKKSFAPSWTPEIIVCETAHPAFDKAAELCGIKLVKVAANKDTYQMDVKQAKTKITKNTIALVGSAPQFPQGIIDPIEDLVKLAKSMNLLVIVDGCLGGLLMPFAKEAGLNITPIDFNLGIDIMTADMHKYGYAEKGNSIVMLRGDLEVDLNKLRLSDQVNFNAGITPMGLYATPAQPGSQPVQIGSLLALLTLGREGYVDCLRKMIEAKNKICQTVQASNDILVNYIQLSGNPQLPIIAFEAKESKHDNGNENRNHGNNNNKILRKIKMLLVASYLKKQGYEVNGLPKPEGFHIAITMANLAEKNFVDNFIQCLRQAVDYAIKNPNEKPSGTLGMYYMLDQKIPKAMKEIFVDKIVNIYLQVSNSNKRLYTQENGNLLPQYKKLCSQGSLKQFDKKDKNTVPKVKKRYIKEFA